MERRGSADSGSSSARVPAALASAAVRARSAGDGGLRGSDALALGNTRTTTETLDETPATVKKSPRLSDYNDAGSESESGAKSDRDVVLLTDCLGRKFSVPWFAAQTWKGMDNLIRGEFLNMEQLYQFVDEGLYELCFMDDFVIERDLWDRLIKPGMEVKMVLQRQPPVVVDGYESQGPQLQDVVAGIEGQEPQDGPPQARTRVGFQVPVQRVRRPPEPEARGNEESSPKTPDSDVESDVVVITVSRSPSPAPQTGDGRITRTGLYNSPPPADTSPQIVSYSAGMDYASPHTNRDIEVEVINAPPQSAPLDTRHRRRRTRASLPDDGSYMSVSSKTATERASDRGGENPYTRTRYVPFTEFLPTSTRMPIRRQQDQVQLPLLDEDRRDVPQRPSLQDARQKGWIFSVELSPAAVTGSNLGGQAQVSFPMGFPKQPEKSKDIFIHSARRHDMEDQQDGPDAPQVFVQYTNVEPSTPSQAAARGPIISKKDVCRWTHMYRRIMNFDEFEYCCRNVFSRPGEPLTAVMELLQKVGSTWCLREGKVVDQGTVVRCDADSKGETKETALFLSIPYLSADKFTVKWDKFHKQFPSHPSRQLYHAVRRFEGRVGRDAGQMFLKKDGRKKDALWVRYLWVVVSDTTMMTYGNISFDELCGTSLVPQQLQTATSSSAVRSIDFVDSEGTILNIDITNTKSFYELKAQIQERIDVSDHLNLVDQENKPFTPDSWNDVRRSRDPLIIRLHAKQPELTTSDADSDDGNGRGEDGNDENDRATQVQETEPSVKLPNLQPHPAVPPFMFWQPASAAMEATTGSIIQALGVLDIIETKFISTSIQTIRIPLDGESWTQTSSFHNPGIYAATKEAGFPELEALVTTNILRHIDATTGPEPDPLSVEGLRTKLYHQIREVHSLTKFFQQAFAPPGLEHPVTRKVFGSLVAIVNTLTQQDDYPETLSSSRMSLERQWIIHIPPQTRYPVLAPSELPNGCEACTDLTIYSSRSTALDHLRRVHMAPEIHFGTQPSSRALREFLQPTRELAQATILRLTFISRILRKTRDRLERLCIITNGIQGALVSEGGEFTSPRNGFPSGLLLAFQQFVLFICWTRYLVQYTDRFFAPATFSQLTSISINRLVRTTDALASLANEVEKYLHSGQAQIIRGFRTGGASSSVFKEVGPVYLIGEIINNLVSRKIASDSDIVELYQSYTDDLEDKGLAEPSKRHRPPLTNLTNEISKLKVITTWQENMLRIYRLATHPRTWRNPSARRKRESPLDKQLIASLGYALRDQRARFTDMQATCRETVDKILEVIEIEKDDQDRAILVFTVVTIIFLPLSFLTSYFSMNVDIVSGGWNGVQRTFWSISVAMTFVLGIVCGVMAYWETLTTWAGNHWRAGEEVPSGDGANWREEVALWRKKERSEKGIVESLRMRASRTRATGASSPQYRRQNV